MATPVSAATRDRWSRASPRDVTNSSQANGRASTNVMSRPAVTDASVTTVVNVTMPMGIDVRAKPASPTRRRTGRHGRSTSNFTVTACAVRTTDSRAPTRVLERGCSPPIRGRRRPEWWIGAIRHRQLPTARRPPALGRPRPDCLRRRPPGRRIAAGDRVHARRRAPHHLLPARPPRHAGPRRSRHHDVPVVLGLRGAVARRGLGRGPGRPRPPGRCDARRQPAPAAGLGAIDSGRTCRRPAPRSSATASWPCT